MMIFVSYYHRCFCFYFLLFLVVVNSVISTTTTTVSSSKEEGPSSSASSSKISSWNTSSGIKKEKKKKHYNNNGRLSKDDGDNDTNVISFLAIGDWGGTDQPPYTTHAQIETAMGMGKVANDIAASFVVALGDNFYFTGLQENTDGNDDARKRFHSTFDTVYSPYLSPSEIQWYVIGGNHDHYGNITVQIEHTYDENPYRQWNFPSLYHSHSFESFSPDDSSDVVTLDLILIDTVQLAGLNEIQDEELDGYFDSLPLKEKYHTIESQLQWKWIESQMQKSNADYLLVGGHYPVYSVCAHGPTPTLIQHLKPLLIQYGAHYLSGHDHCMAHYEEGENEVNTTTTTTTSISRRRKLRKEEEEKDRLTSNTTTTTTTTTHYVLSGMGDMCCYNAKNLDNIHNKWNPPRNVLKWYVSNENRNLNNYAIGGFTSFRATKKEMIIRYHDHNGNIIFTANSIRPRNNKKKK